MSICQRGGIVEAVAYQTVSIDLTEKAQVRFQADRQFSQTK